MQQIGKLAEIGRRRKKVFWPPNSAEESRLASRKSAEEVYWLAEIVKKKKN
jgi:hypothetical protein